MKDKIGRKISSNIFFFFPIFSILYVLQLKNPKFFIHFYFGDVFYRFSRYVDILVEFQNCFSGILISWFTEAGNVIKYLVMILFWGNSKHVKKYYECWVNPSATVLRRWKWSTINTHKYTYGAEMIKMAVICLFRCQYAIFDLPFFLNWAQ